MTITSQAWKEKIRAFQTEELRSANVLRWISAICSHNSKHFKRPFLHRPDGQNLEQGR